MEMIKDMTKRLENLSSGLKLVNTSSLELSKIYFDQTIINEPRLAVAKSFLVLSHWCSLQEGWRKIFEAYKPF